jgi:hypothetical protein
VDNSKIVLDLCGGTGSWSKPYRDAGYDVRVITLPEQDIRTYEPPENIRGVLAAPPCTHFSVSGAQYWPAKDKDGRTLSDLEVLTGCLRIIIKAKPTWWVMENPVGRMRRWMGKPVMYFNPCDFGDPYTKKTALWGEFSEPEKHPVEPQFIVGKRDGKRYSPIHYAVRTPDRAKIRSITPQGFAQALFEANR